MDQSSQYRLEKISGPYAKVLQDSVLKFLYSLTTEQESFLLNQEQVLKALELFIIKDLDGQKIIGLAGIRPQKFYGLLFLVVHKDFQGMGLGKKLLLAVLETVPRNKLLLLTVHRSNVKARKLYKTNHFLTMHRHKILAYMIYGNRIGRILKWPMTWAIQLSNWMD